MIRHNILCISVALSLLSSSIAYAVTLNLYDQPKTDAKVVGKIDTESGFVPIFTPKPGDWMKVGDPKNGNVGWIQTKQL